MKVVFSVIISIFLFSMNQNSFKKDQKKYPRVRQAYNSSEVTVLELLSQKGIEANGFEIYLRAFKAEDKLELWGRTSDKNYQLIKVYDVCTKSGIAGPKREQGDLQVPEGFYHIDRFNPKSRFHLSLGLNYPNASDKILGVKGNLGADIFIHGDCVTVGCLPIEDNWIEELYVFCVEARNGGQLKIPITVYPQRMKDSTYDKLISEYKESEDVLNLWSDLKEAYTYFEKHRQLPKITFLSNGRHSIK
jgi:murein L,D-transpeptidase YafK